MASDVKLDGETVLAEGQVFKAASWDFDLDGPGRRKAGADGRRRALVHDFDDGLTLNWDFDYPGGVSINGTLNGDLTQHRERGGCVKAVVRFDGAGLQNVFNSQRPRDARNPESFAIRHLGPDRPIFPPRPFPPIPGEEEPPVIAPTSPNVPTGTSVVTFPFKVDDLVVLVTPEHASPQAVTAAYSFTGNEKEVRVRTWDKDGKLIPSAFSLVVF